MIARTETKYAQNVSSLEVYNASDVMMGTMAFDNQTGFGDDGWTLRDGNVFSVDDAETK